MALAMVIPRAAHWNVYVAFPPLFASWRPTVGPGTPVAVIIAAGGLVLGPRLSARLSWPRLLLAAWAVGLGWLGSLALADIHHGWQSYPDVDEFLQTARATHNTSQALHDFVSRIPANGHPWPTHVAGHPPGALLFFVVLVRVGLGGNLAAGTVITLMASTIPLAVLTALRALQAEPAARLAAPFLVLAPAAIWQAVSADAVYACVAAWALAVLAIAAARRSVTLGVAAGLLAGLSVEMSYGLLLLGILAVAVLIAAGSYRPLPWAIIGAVCVVAVFWSVGFSWWEAYPALRERYQAGVGGLRPASYWLWGDLAALCFSAGPVVGPAVGRWVAVMSHGRPRAAVAQDRRVSIILGGAAIVAIAAADTSLMSKAEVERIWLPFVPWLLVLSALLPPRWRRPALCLQVVTALLVQHLLVTAW
jgi:hypothetical protein